MKLQVGNKVLDLEHAKSIYDKKIGLLKYESIPKDGLVMLFPEKDEINIHTIGLPFAIDVIFVLNSRVRSIHSLLPNSKVSDFAEMVIELPLGNAGEFNIIEGMDVKKVRRSLKERVSRLSQGGQIKIIGEGGKVVKEIEDDVRIVSRVETKKLIELATKNTKSSNIELGSFMVKVINGQDRRPKDTVTIKSN